MTRGRVWLTIVLALVIVAIYDTYLYSDGIPGNSITQVIRAELQRSPLFAGLLGALFGSLFFHFFDSGEQSK